MICIWKDITYIDVFPLGRTSSFLFDDKTLLDSYVYIYIYIYLVVGMAYRCVIPDNILIKSVSYVVLIFINVFSPDDF